MSGVLTLLAILGGLALVSRVARTLLRLAFHAAEVTAAAGMADVSARRGDLTGLSERRENLERARQQRTVELLFLLLWLTWLSAPLMLGWMPHGYAAAALLWLMPNRPILRR